MEKMPLPGEAGALAPASEKQPNHDTSLTSAHWGALIGNNAPEVMDGVIKKLQAAVPAATALINSAPPSGIPAFDFLRLPLGGGQLVDLVHAVELASKERITTAKAKNGSSKRESRSSKRDSSSDDEDAYKDEPSEKVERQRRSKRPVKPQDEEEEEFIPSSAAKRKPHEDNIIEGTGEKTNVIKRHGSWSHEEDQKLLQHVRETNGRDWKSAAREFPGKSASQCAQRWRRVLNPALNKGPITFVEEKQIMEFKSKGLGWAAIGLKMKRVDLTIRYWWRKFKASHKASFVSKEDEALLAAVESFGTDFDAIYEHLKSIKVCPPNLLARTPFSWALRYQTLSGKEMSLPPLPPLDDEQTEIKPKDSDGTLVKKKRSRGGSKDAKPPAKRKTRSVRDSDEDEENENGFEEEEEHDEEEDGANPEENGNGHENGGTEKPKNGNGTKRTNTAKEAEEKEKKGLNQSSATPPPQSNENSSMGISPKATEANTNQKNTPKGN